ncbi:hypothetical protein ANN_04462 [Periplaneta americana]|uniref:Uncharacterized protein n=1 Tax=Periplaneta americana TaxID=6978 RepID=A0ABQ8T8M3_PERAM|nr:hypothetical protein ANN_04462 [Periplaneta americana]
MGTVHINNVEEYTTALDNILQLKRRKTDYERIPNLSAEQSDGITMFRISPMESLMLHRCRTGAISLQKWLQSPSAAISESDWFLYRARISRRMISCTVVSWRREKLLPGLNLETVSLKLGVYSADEEFPRRWIGRTGSIRWPPRSPDLTSLDFFFWGFMKDRVYATKPCNFPELVERIEHTIQTVTPDMLIRIHEELIRQLTFVHSAERKTFGKLYTIISQQFYIYMF